MNLEEQSEIKIKEELISVYSSFLENPGDEGLKNGIQELDAKYSGLIAYLDHSVEKLISKDLIEALLNLSSLRDYGVFEDNHSAFSKSKILEKAKEILNNLKK